MQHITSSDSSSFHQDSSIEPISLVKEKDQPGESLRTSRESVELPFEILDKIIKNLRGDHHTLLNASLASKQTLHSSRQILFSTVVFLHGSGGDFDTFLSLLDAPWTSLSVIRRIHIRRVGATYQLDVNRNMDRIFSHLKKVESLWLTGMSWCSTTPPPIIRLVTSLNITDIQLERLYIPTCNWMNNLLAWLPRTIKTISIYHAEMIRMNSDEAHERRLIPNPSLHERQLWYFQNLDSHSMIRLRKVWDPLLLSPSSTKLCVETLYLQICELGGLDIRKDLPFISDFIKLAGASIKAISLDRGFDTATGWDPIPAFESLDFSQCTNIDQIHIELIGDTTSSFWANLIWKLLSPFVSINSLRHVILTIILNEKKPERENVDLLLMFPWEETVKQIHRKCRGLEKVVVRIGADEPTISDQYIEELRKTELRKLEQAGVLGFQRYQWTDEYAYWQLDWRDAFKINNYDDL